MTSTITKTSTTTDVAAALAVAYNADSPQAADELLFTIEDTFALGRELFAVEGRMTRYRFLSAALAAGNVKVARSYDYTDCTVVHASAKFEGHWFYSGGNLVLVYDRAGNLVRGAFDIGRGTDLAWSEHDRVVDAPVVGELFARVAAALTAA